MGQTEKQKLWKQKYYENNKEYHRQRQNERRKEVKEYIESLKDQCIICGENDVACLDFHHIDDEQKDNSLSNAIRNKWGKERIDTEVSKCVVLCSNCHRKVHYYNIEPEDLMEN